MDNEDSLENFGIYRQLTSQVTIYFEFKDMLEECLQSIEKLRKAKPVVPTFIESCLKKVV